MALVKIEVNHLFLPIRCVEFDSNLKQFFFKSTSMLFIMCVNCFCKFHETSADPEGGGGAGGPDPPPGKSQKYRVS